jgi:hypothetical protein
MADALSEQCLETHGGRNTILGPNARSESRGSGCHLCVRRRLANRAGQIVDRYCALHDRARSGTKGVDAPAPERLVGEEGQRDRRTASP